MGFINYEKAEAVEPRVLTDDEKKAITDDFAEGKNVTEIKHTRFIPTNLILQSIKHKKDTEKLVIQLMKGNYLIAPEVSHLDEETGEKVIDTEAEYNSKPTTLVNLKAQVNLHRPDCSITDYNIDSIISNGTSAGTWTAFKECF